MRYCDSTSCLCDMIAHFLCIITCRSRRLKKHNTRASSSSAATCSRGADDAAIHSSLSHHNTRATDPHSAAAGYGSTVQSSGFDTPQSYASTCSAPTTDTGRDAEASRTHAVSAPAAVASSLDRLRALSHNNKHVINPIFTEFCPNTEPRPDYPKPQAAHRNTNKRSQVGFSDVGIAFRNQGYDSSSDQGSTKGQYFLNL